MPIFRPLLTKAMIILVFLFVFASGALFTLYARRVDWQYLVDGGLMKWLRSSKPVAGEMSTNAGATQGTPPLPVTPSLLGATGYRPISSVPAAGSALIPETAVNDGASDDPAYIEHRLDEDRSDQLVNPGRQAYFNQTDDDDDDDAHWTRAAVSELNRQVNSVIATVVDDDDRPAGGHPAGYAESTPALQAALCFTTESHGSDRASAVPLSADLNANDEPAETLVASIALNAPGGLRLAEATDEFATSVDLYMKRISTVKKAVVGIQRAIQRRTIHQSSDEAVAYFIRMLDEYGMIGDANVSKTVELIFSMDAGDDYGQLYDEISMATQTGDVELLAELTGQTD